MSEESPIMNPELYEEIDKEVEGKAVEIERTTRRRRRRRSEDDEMPLSLDKISGREVVEILRFLHRHYLSWMTEAESTKFSTVYRSAKEEALKETLDLYNELHKQVSVVVDKLEKITERLEKLEARTTTTQETAKKTVEEIKKSILDDPRVRSLLLVLLETTLGKNEQYKKFRPLIAKILLPEAFEKEEKSGTPQETKVEGVENEGQS